MKFSFILTLLAVVNLSWSQEIFDQTLDDALQSSVLEKSQIELIKQELRIQSIFIEGVKEIEIETGKPTLESDSSNKLKALLERAMVVKTETLPKEMQTQAKEVVSQGFKKDAATSIVTKLKNFLNDQTASHTQKLSSVVRRFGYDVGLVYFLTLQVDLTFPSIMIALGHLEFAPLLAMPVSSVGTGAYTALKSYAKTRQLTKNLGGKLKVRERQQVYARLKSFFNNKVGSKYDLIEINLDGNNHTLSVQRQTLMTKLKQKLGWNKELNYQNLVKTLQTEGLVTPELDNIISSNSPKEIKLLKVLNSIEQSQDETTIQIIKSRYAEFIHELPRTPGFSDAKDWVTKVSRSKSFEEFGSLMTRMPDDIPPRSLDRLWREVIVPSAATSIGPFIDNNGFTAFKNFRVLWDKKVRRPLVEGQALSLDHHLKSLIGEMLLESMAPVNGCTILFEPRSNYIPLL